MIPKGHLLRRIDVFVSDVLGDLHEQLGPFYSDIGRPSIDPELLIRMHLVGYCFGIRSDAIATSVIRAPGDDAHQDQDHLQAERLPDRKLNQLGHFWIASVKTRNPQNEDMFSGVLRLRTFLGGSSSNRVCTRQRTGRLGRGSGRPTASCVGVGLLPCREGTTPPRPQLPHNYGGRDKPGHRLFLCRSLWPQPTAQLAP
jgi:hypothetical protein